MRLENIITTMGHLNLYLTWKGLKKASILDSHIYRTKLSEEPRPLTITREHIERRGLCYREEKYAGIVEIAGIGAENIIAKVNYKFLIAREDKALEELVNAKSHEAKGMALGYPEEAAKAYGKVIKGIKRNAAYVLVEMAKAVKAGIEIPRWMAYLSYAIEQIDLINGNISASSEALGRDYQRYVRRHNPRLAFMAEDFFNKIELPESWELAKSGKYEIKYKKR